MKVPLRADRASVPAPALKFGKSLDRIKSVSRPNLLLEKTLHDQWRRNAPTKLFQTFLWPFWAIPMA
jgi:hypothetical protein